MFELAAVGLMAALLLGVAANQVTRILRQGSLFAGLRECIEWRRLPCPWWLQNFLHDLFDCHLCLGQEVSIFLTWFAVAAAIAVDPAMLPAPGWAILIGVGPFVVGGVDQFIELLRGFQRD